MAGLVALIATALSGDIALICRHEDSVSSLFPAFIFAQTLAVDSLVCIKVFFLRPGSPHVGFEHQFPIVRVQFPNGLSSLRPNLEL